MSEIREERIDGADAAQWDAVEEATELLHEERFYDALLFLREVIKNDAKNPYAFYFLGVALYESGELEPARDAYRACLAVAPKHMGARVALSHVLRELGDTRAAIREGMEALALVPGDSDALHSVGLAYTARGENVAARKYLEAFLESKPEFEVATDVRALLVEMTAQNGGGMRSN